MFSSRKTYEVCFYFDVCVDKESYEIKDVSFKNCSFMRNFRYDTERQEMMKLTIYKSIYIKINLNIVMENRTPDIIIFYDFNELFATKRC